MSVRILHGDALELLPTLAGLDACVCDPPYHLTSIVKRFGSPNAAPAQFGTDGAFARASRGFMGKQWDGGDIALRSETWALVLKALKPGAHLLAFGGTRTFHRMACAIEDAGFEIRDTIMWVYGSGFPKSHDVSKGIDKAAGAEREVVGVRVNTYDGARRDPSKHGNPADQSNIGKWGLTQTPHGMPLTSAATPEAAAWSGWGTALKPAWEPIIVARRPLVGTVAQNVLKHGTGAINVDGCRVATDETITATRNIALGSSASGVYGAATVPGVYQQNTAGRWPANLCLSFPEDQYILRSDVTTAQKQELYRWLHENA